MLKLFSVFSVLSILSLSLTLSACSSGKGSSSGSVAAQMNASLGTNQTGLVGTAVNSPFVVQLVNSSGQPAVGTVVNWTITSGNGTLSATQTSTNSQGYTQSLLTLSTQPGNYTVTATANGYLPMTFSGTGIAGPATTFSVASGSSQISAVVNTPLVFNVKVSDGYGNPVPGVTITWNNYSGNGQLSNAALVTNSAGQASANFQVGKIANLYNQVTVQAVGTQIVGAGITYVVIPTPAAPASLTLSAGGSMGAGSQTTYSATLVDTYGNLINNDLISWSVSGGGTLSSPSSSTNNQGIASVQLTAGKTEGTYQINASYSASVYAQNSFNVTAGTATQVSIVSGNNQSGIVTNALPTSFTANFTDSYGNPVVGAPVTWFVAPYRDITGWQYSNSAYGHLTSASGVTDSNGNATGSLTLGTLAGSFYVSATVGGQSITGMIFGGDVATFNVTSLPGPVSQFIFATNSNNFEHGYISTSLVLPLTALVADAYGNGVSGIPVSWSVPAGSDGSVSAVNANTDSSGQSYGNFTLGAFQGQYPVTASVPSSYGLSSLSYIAIGGDYYVSKTAFNCSGSAADTVSNAQAMQSGSTAAIAALLITEPFSTLYLNSNCQSQEESNGQIGWLCSQVFCGSSDLRACEQGFEITQNLSLVPSSAVSPLLCLGVTSL